MIALFKSFYNENLHKVKRVTKTYSESNVESQYFAVTEFDVRGY